MANVTKPAAGHIGAKAPEAEDHTVLAEATPGFGVWV